MDLKVKFLKWSAGIPVVMLHKKTAEKMGAHTHGRVLIKTISKKPRELVAIIDTIKNHLVSLNQIAVSAETKKILNLETGQKVQVDLFQSSPSLNLIKRKLNKKTLSEKQINQIIGDIVNNSLSDPEVALFVSSMYKQGMNMKETVALIKAILKTGNKLSFNKKYVVDKHSIGGIPGNRTTPIIVAICAAAGLIFPKTSSRAITSAAGTVDVIEAIADVDFSVKEIKKIVSKTGACMVWGGGLGLVPADSKILQVEKILKIDPEAQLLASIISKKLAVGSKYILIDIPYGKNAKVTRSFALKLKKKFEALGRYFHKDLRVVLTKGDQPIGNGIGPNLEIQDILRVLDPEKISPKRLEQKSLFLAGEILEMVGKSKRGEGIILARKILESGEAFKKFKQIIKAQGGNINKVKKAKFKKDIFCPRDSKIKEIKNQAIATLARIAGSPVDKEAGLYLYYHIGERVKKGEKFLSIYAKSKSRLKDAVEFYKKNKPIKLK